MAMGTCNLFVFLFDFVFEDWKFWGILNKLRKNDQRLKISERVQENNAPQVKAGKI